LLGTEHLESPVIDVVDTAHTGFNSSVNLESVEFSYPGKSVPAVKDATLSISPGQSVAFVGGSGAGKTTIVDILLGVLSPKSGSVKISNVAPLVAVVKWPGAVSYVPQDVTISNGTIRENVSLGFSSEFVSDEMIWAALDIAQLSDFVRQLPEQLDTKVGERGTKISGGQRQRLGIARAMFTKPKLLVLDEATSSLDGQTESDISDAINILKGDVTVVMIAHRLSTVRHSDLVVYLDQGRILAQGSFEEVRSQVPNFDKQAQLMGL
jgi:ABC-type multidrug transport system fused ATPase/permease subunit